MINNVDVVAFLFLIRKIVLPVNIILLNYLQWVDCVSQLLRMYPFAFEFSSVSKLLGAA